METFKICKKTNEVISTVPLDYDRIVTSGNELCLVIEKSKALELSVGSKLHFEKFGSGTSDEMLKVCEEDALVKDVVDSGDTRYIYFEYVYITPLTISSFKNISSHDGYKYKFYFTTDHHMLPCDLSGDYKLYVRRGSNVLEFGTLAFCYPNEVSMGADIVFDGGDCTVAHSKSFNYETMERNSVLAKTKAIVDGLNFNPEAGDQVFFATNPYFYTDEDGVVHLYPRTDGCSPAEVVNVCKYVNFMGLGIVLEQDYDAKRMLQEYQVNELFVKKIKNSIIPDFIDLEKVKYAPAYASDDKIFLATGLTFNLHFRTRVPDPEDRYGFEDTWHLTDTTDTWNGNGLDNPPVGKDDLYSDPEFVNSSNLMGYLGFTDDDVYNQKNRVKQSFIRLSFYDGNNPLTQSLLYYSTIFLDSGDLYGKYVKRKAWLEEDDENYDNQINPVVWSSAATTDPVPAVTSQLIVNDEYDMTRSGEGFNLYLFRQDAPLEKEHQDIYMKVEFNHAGYGRTIPLIYWGKDDDTGKPKTLKVSNYRENLYIPVRITLSDNGYVYMFPNAKSAENGEAEGILWKDDRLVFNLFEPMIEPEDTV